MIKFISIIAFIVSFFCLLVGLSAWQNTNASIDSTKPYVQIIQKAYPDSGFNKNFEKLYLIRRIVHAIIIFTGLIGLLVSSGLWFIKEWARISWLAMVTFIVVSFWFLSTPWSKDFQNGDFCTLGLFTFIGILSWIVLTKEVTKDKFKV
jgi:hypothetical protein